MAEITGVVQSVAKNDKGWWEIQVEGAPGKLTTKKDDVAQQFSALLAQVALARFTPKQGTNVNPHTNQPYMNYYADGALPGQPAAPDPAPAAVQASSSPPAAAGPGINITVTREQSWLAVSRLLPPGTAFGLAKVYANAIEADILRGADAAAFGADDNSEDDIPF